MFGCTRNRALCTARGQRHHPGDVAHRGMRRMRGHRNAQTMRVSFPHMVIILSLVLRSRDSG